jgi:hypothetical protein
MRRRHLYAGAAFFYCLLPLPLPRTGTSIYDTLQLQVDIRQEMEGYNES